MNQETVQAGIELGPKFQKRLKIHEMIKKQSLGGINERGWSRNQGEYGRIFAKGFFSEEKVSLKTKESLSELETLLYFYILFLIKKQSKTPIVCVDIGGMNGVSMLRLAHQFQDEIDDGIVEFFVTNLGFIPTEESIKAASEDTEDANVIMESFSNGNISYLTQDIVEFVKTMKKRGTKVDVCHEMDALMHGYVNDRDLTHLANVLSEDALIMVKHLEAISFIVNSVDNKNHMGTERFAAHKLGLKAIAQSGFDRVDLRSESGYDIFTKPTSPFLDIIDVLIENDE